MSDQTPITFNVESQCPGTSARAGVISTLRGHTTQTPVFMPVGTQATVKGMRVEDLKEIGANILLANTYHLLLRPGAEVFRKFGGIHQFMKWDRAVLTDSGGFQIFSLPNARDITEEGAAFRSYIDGRRIMLSPEASIGMQQAIGSDIMMVLDVCVPSTCSHDVAREAMERTHRWAMRSLVARQDGHRSGARADGPVDQGLFAIVQGACFEDLRKASASFLTDYPFDGFAIGGLAVGETKSEREDFTELTTALLPQEKPRYLMGVGTPIDLLEAVHRGVDMFDCILPTAHAQHGAAWTSTGLARMRRGVYRLQDDPLDAACTCYTCRTYERGYIHHLIKAEEGLGWRLIAQHNLHFYQQLMAEMRCEILAGTFAQYYRAKREHLVMVDQESVMQVPRPGRNRPRLTLGNYEIVVGDDSRGRIRQVSSGESMHPGGAPDVEAQELYAQRSGLTTMLRDPARTILTIWDVGLGVAHNAMAAVRGIEAAAAESDAALPVVQIVSFENDCDSLRLGLKNVRYFPHLKHAAPHVLLRDGHWASQNPELAWTLVVGDFRDCYPSQPRPDLVFWDPFSSKTDADLWTFEVFSGLNSFLGDHATVLVTYSASTAVRALLLAAGFYVLEIPGSGARETATMALTRAAWEQRAELVSEATGARQLGSEWFQRWTRSSSRIPASWRHPAGEFDHLIRKHPLFSQFEG